MSDSVRPHGLQPTRLPRPWNSPSRNTGVDCHFLLQCVKVKSKSEVAQSCPTLSNRMDCSPPGFSVHGIFQARALEWGAITFSVKIVHIKEKKKVFEKTNKQNCLFRQHFQNSLRIFSSTPHLVSDLVSGTHSIRFLTPVPPKCIYLYYSPTPALLKDRNHVLFILETSALREPAPIRCSVSICWANEQTSVNQKWLWSWDLKIWGRFSSEPYKQLIWLAYQHRRQMQVTVWSLV